MTNANDPAHDPSSGEIEWQYSLVEAYFDKGAGDKCQECRYRRELYSKRYGYYSGCTVVDGDEQPDACPAWSQIIEEARNEHAD